MFENATRKNFRYPTNRGLITTEQLWDLPLQAKTAFDLDNVARVLNRELKDQGEESFVSDTASTVAAELKAKLDVVVHVINVRKAEKLAATTAATKRAERARLTEILHIKTEEELKQKSPAEIQAMIDALG